LEKNLPRSNKQSRRWGGWWGGKRWGSGAFGNVTNAVAKKKQMRKERGGDSKEQPRRESGEGGKVRAEKERKGGWIKAGAG